MIDCGLHIRGTDRFKEKWSGIDRIKRFNLVIGKNNSGKSILTSDLALIISKQKGSDSKYVGSMITKKPKFELRCTRIIDDTFCDLLNSNTNNWDERYDHKKNIAIDNVKYLKNNYVSFAISSTGNINDIEILDPFGKNLENNHSAKDFISSINGKQLFAITRELYPTYINTVYSIDSDRDICYEKINFDENVVVSGSGSNMTSFLRNLLNSSAIYSMQNDVRKIIVDDLNEILGGDESFSGFDVRELSLTDDRIAPLITKAKKETGKEKEDSINIYEFKYCEIYLNHIDKGWVSLAKSGSGIKTIIFVIVLLKILPQYQGVNIKECLFIFEELENNLHPYTIRRLYNYIFDKINNYESLAFFTTHSSIVLDLFSTIDGASITRVISDGSSAYTQPINNILTIKDTHDDLGSKASDLMLSNGVIWVEGPSDRIYINKWIEIFSEANESERLYEGRHYSIAFYGGSNLASVDFPGASVPDSEKVNAEAINKNFFVICDRDDAVISGDLKKRVQTIKSQLEESSRSHLLWITQAREIENYITAKALNMAKVSQSVITNSPSLDDQVFGPANTNPFSRKNSFATQGRDKLNFARQVSKHMILSDMKQRFDWAEQMGKLVQAIQKWNS